MKLTAEVTIAAPFEIIWQRTQTPEAHRRWDLRFTNIEYLPRTDPAAPQRFRYLTRLGMGLTIGGWGETVGTRAGRNSALRFGSDDPKSLIREGSGAWIYEDTPEGIRFATVYDYRTRYGLPGRLLDRLFFRPLMIWATRWSFDGLKLWIETGTPPETLFRLWLVKLAARFALGLVWIHEGLVPKILAVSPSEIALVAKTGLYWPNPNATLAALGIAEILTGLWLLSGWKERAAA